MPLLASIQDFFFEWYPVFGVFFSAGLLIVFVILLRNTMGTTRPESVKASKTGTVLWEEVQGVDAAKEELVDVAEWLKDPKRFEVLGARAPRGVLLYGPPGTGKTMLARAVAAHAGVDFFAASGSSFVEMFVGRGAARIRRLFKEARQIRPRRGLHRRARRGRWPSRLGRRRRRHLASASRPSTSCWSSSTASSATPAR